MIWESRSLAEFESIASEIISNIRPGTVIALFGEMGAGKTTFVCAVATALGITDWVSSPTFALVQQYDGPVPIRHLDLYRLQGADANLLDLEHYLHFPEGIVIVEWPQVLGRRLEDCVHLTIDVLDHDSRRITMCA